MCKRTIQHASKSICNVFITYTVSIKWPYEYKLNFFCLFSLNQLELKVAGVKVNPRKTWNFKSHEVSACIGLWHRRLMHAPHMLMHACTACIVPWHHRPMHAVTACSLSFWFCLRYTFISRLWLQLDTNSRPQVDEPSVLPLCYHLWLNTTLTLYIIQ